MTEQQQLPEGAEAPKAPEVLGPPEPERVPEEPTGASATPPRVPAPKDRRVLRAVLRWTAAVAVFAAVGAGSAYGIVGMERTDVPGLATGSDGRWPYPVLSRPPLPSGSPGPFAATNVAGAHHADLRALLLPAPRGATEDRALRGRDGWLATKDFLAEYELKEDREELDQKLLDRGLRHIAARGWTTEDGTRTRVYLLQFRTAAVVDKLIATEAVAFADPVHQVRGAAEAVYDETFPERAAVSGVQRFPYAENKPYGPEQVRFAHLAAGDVYALIIQSRKGGAAAVPFQQTVTLQGQLLG
ncbi:hypothetical protein ACFYO5_31340 [Streptomyces sp. NPDC006259]|uniref:hypothetical protein n=1 Tax=Streptomyces sp. NPDC006259 TaxID=3364740 RepID=UPI0036C0ADCE